MAIPSTLIPFDGSLEGQDRNGPLTLTSQGALHWVDSDRTERQMVRPLVVMSPDGSEDTDGALTPAVGANVTLGAGKHGQTWRMGKAVTPPPVVKVTVDERRDQDGPFSINTVGAVRTVGSGTERAWFLEGPATNLIPNPSFEEGTEGWSRQGVTIEQDTMTSVVGSASCRMVNDRGLNGDGMFTPTRQIPVEPNTTYAVSFWAKASRANRIRTYNSFWDSEGVQVGNSGYLFHDVTTEWQRISYTFTTSENAASTYQVIYVPHDDPQVGDTVWIDGVQMEQDVVSTSYVDGSLGFGYAWAGTPHQSASIRSGQNVYFPMSYVDSTGATIVARMRPVATTTRRCYWWLGSGGTVPSFQAYADPNGSVTVRVENQTISAPEGSAPFGQWHTMMLTWNGGKARAYLNGEFIGEAEVSASGWEQHTGIYARVTAQASSLEHGGWLVFPRHLTEPERNAVFAMDSWDWDHLSAPDGEVELESDAISAITPDHRILVRYKEDGEVHEELLTDAGMVGQYGRLITREGVLKFQAYKGDFELESAALFDKDVTPNVARMLNLPNWTLQRLSMVQEVPIKVPRFEEPTRNLIARPLDPPWPAFNSFFGADPDVTFQGTIAARHEATLHTTASKGTSTPMMPIDPTQPITVSFYVKKSHVPIRPSVSLYLYDANNASIRATGFGFFIDPNQVDEWVRVERTFTDLPANAAQARLYMYVTDFQEVGECVWYAQLQIEQKPYATSYAYGTLGEGYSWEGEPFHSASVRESGRIVLPEPETVELTPYRGCVAMRVRFLEGGSNSRYVYFAGNAGQVWGLPWFATADGIRAYFRRPDGGQDQTPIRNITHNEWMTIFLEWDEDTLTQRIGTDMPLSRARTMKPSPTDRFTPQVQGISYPTQPKNMEVACFATFSRPLDEKERSILRGAESWEWETVIPKIGGMVRHFSDEPLGVRKTTRSPIVIEED